MPDIIVGHSMKLIILKKAMINIIDIFEKKFMLNIAIVYKKTIPKVVY